MVARAAIGATLLAGAFVIARWLPLESGLAALRAWVDARGPLGMVGFGAAYVLLVLVLVPGAALTLIAGAVFGFVWGVIVVAGATSVADAIAFLLARHVARGAIERLSSRSPRFDALDRAITQGGWRIVALLRLNPTMPYSVSNYLFGVTGVSFFPYLLASGLFTLPGAVVYVYLGHVGGQTLVGQSHSPLEWALLAVGLLATIAAAAYVTFLARRSMADPRS